MRQGHQLPRTHIHSEPQHQHRKKRQFQPSITSFFAFDDRDSGSEDERGPGPDTRPHQRHASEAAKRYQQQQRDSLAPAVPGRVQADLLSVGMRVRKSVPEGYKTHKVVSLPSIQTTLAMKGTHGATMTTTLNEYSVKPTTDAVPDDYVHQRELLPFSGLQKIGGYAEQPVTNVHLYGGTDASGERAMNLYPLPAQAFTQPFSSQSSTDSSVSSSSLRPNPTNHSKRSWQDEDDRPARLNADFFFKIPVKISEDEVPVSPLSESPPQSIHVFPEAALRPFAQPKSRRQPGRAMDMDGMIVKEGDVDMDLENARQTEGRVLSGNSSDFDEADFLMGGV